MGFWFNGVWQEGKQSDKLAVPIQGVMLHEDMTTICFGAKIKSDIDKAMGL